MAPAYVPLLHSRLKAVITRGEDTEECTLESNEACSGTYMSMEALLAAVPHAVTPARHLCVGATKESLSGHLTVTVMSASNLPTVDGGDFPYPFVMLQSVSMAGTPASPHKQRSTLGKWFSLPGSKAEPGSEPAAAAAAADAAAAAVSPATMSARCSYGAPLNASGSARTKAVGKKTINPTFNEELVVAVDNAKELLVSVMTQQSMLGDETVLGTADLNFAKLDLKPGTPQELLCSLQPQGELVLELVYRDARPLFGTDLAAVFDREGGVPNVIKQCTKLIEQRGAENRGIYREPGVKSRYEQGLRNTFNHQPSHVLLPEDAVDYKDVASLLKLYFRQLPDPLFTAALHHAFVDVAARAWDARKADEGGSMAEIRKEAAALIGSLPAANRKVLAHIFKHLRLIVNCQTNEMTAVNVATCFGPSLLLGNHPELAYLASDIAHLARINAVIVLVIETPDSTSDGGGAVGGSGSGEGGGRGGVATRVSKMRSSIKPVKMVKQTVVLHDSETALLCGGSLQHSGVPVRAGDVGEPVTVDGNLQAGILREWDVGAAAASGVQRGCVVEQRHHTTPLHAIKSAVKLTAKTWLHHETLYVCGLPGNPKKFSKRFAVMAGNGLLSFHAKAPSSDPSMAALELWTLGLGARYKTEYDVPAGCSAVVSNDVKWGGWPGGEEAKVDRRLIVTLNNDAAAGAAGTLRLYMYSTTARDCRLWSVSLKSGKPFLPGSRSRTLIWVASSSTPPCLLLRSKPSATARCGRLLRALSSDVRSS